MAVVLAQVGQDMIHRLPRNGLARDPGHLVLPSKIFRWIAASNAGPGAA